MKDTKNEASESSNGQPATRGVRYLTFSAEEGERFSENTNFHRVRIEDTRKISGES